MTAFDSFHPALQHHIVNTLGWKELRPLQEEGAEIIREGRHALMLAPTAGGKTEAAVFPLLSRALSENWPGLSILYICPIKALLNSLFERLSFYSALVGLRCAVWHGDISAGERRKIIKEPPQILLTTPESLEVMLISRRVDHRALFHDLQAVVIDEVHAFAGDDRGWHLLSVLERIQRVSGRKQQRIGLSATVGNPETILAWLDGRGTNSGRIVAPDAGGKIDAEIQLDYVGNLDNAAVVISRLHQGEKRLVFCDSRARVERLASRLRGLGVNTFVSHSSLSAEERKRAEEAFSQGDDCVIVATSTLELGIDVGDLDRVIQIDAPSTVSSFLQRLGRTGRRSGARKNCLFLATHDDALVQAAALVHLWEGGFVEPVLPPAEPAHILAHQIMALTLQENGIGTETWQDWIGGVPGFAEIVPTERHDIVDFMVESGTLMADQGILSFDRQGEKHFGYRNFMELCSVFTSPPLFTVLNGQNELGSVHESSFAKQEEGNCILLLGGKSWEVTHVDWRNRKAIVKPAASAGCSRWIGGGPLTSVELCREIRHILVQNTTHPAWSQRATKRLDGVRDEYSWLPEEGTALVQSSNGSRWWTFAGSRANMALANALHNTCGVECVSEGLFINIAGPQILKTKLLDLVNRCADDITFSSKDIAGTYAKGLKFSLCLPPASLEKIYRNRFLDIRVARHILMQGIHEVCHSNHIYRIMTE